jgi:hypothetical protein
MSKRRNGKPAPRGRGRGSDDYRVGKYRPPPEHRWPPGQSGNPRGRPKGRKSSDTILREILDRKLKVSMNGRVRSVSVRELMLTRFADAALKGDIKCASFLLQRDDVAQADQTQQQRPESALSDREIIEAFLKSHLSKGTTDNANS